MQQMCQEKQKCRSCSTWEREKLVSDFFFFKFPALIPLAVFAAFIFYEIPLFVHVMNSQWRIILFE